ncbi:Cys-tRNA(Pro) deacylase [Mycobacterium sp. IDR2000157661]|uniref:Cys-tRNA(Pro) deacylase n=1 Tax=Mycobacterium sp. IDR2000157661 TaxID=2867005 RepID=UPI001EEC300A|nr:Cys-tRNA(Pro) deacylase [Mycobacterium sp. IDR2000157661]ULE33559.1 Cys-tRNA(Pro) deacylase [Mycobacterium sp. IDR2000157661]
MVRAATPAIAALVAAGIDHEVLRYRHDPRRESFGEEAVEELARERGVEPAQVFKTLVIALSDGRVGVAVLPVPAKLSLKAAAAALGVGKATMADRAAAERSTGYVLGGISPLGQRKSSPTVVDASALQWDRVLCSAGKRGWDVALHPRDLVRLTHAVTADIRAYPPRYQVPVRDRPV